MDFCWKLSDFFLPLLIFWARVMTIPHFFVVGRRFYMDISIKIGIQIQWGKKKKQNSQRKKRVTICCCIYQNICTNGIGLTLVDSNVCCIMRVSRCRLFAHLHSCCQWTYPWESVHKIGLFGHFNRVQCANQLFQPFASVFAVCIVIQTNRTSSADACVSQSTTFTWLLC